MATKTAKKTKNYVAPAGTIAAYEAGRLARQNRQPISDSQGSNNYIEWQRGWTEVFNDETSAGAMDGTLRDAGIACLLWHLEELTQDQRTALLNWCETAPIATGVYADDDAATQGWLHRLPSFMCRTDRTIPADNLYPMARVIELSDSTSDLPPLKPIPSGNPEPETKGEKPMAKKAAVKATSKGRLPTMEDADDQPNVPSELIELGLQFKRAQKKEADAKGNTKEVFTSIKDMMHKRDITRFRVEIDGKRKWLILAPTEKLKWEEVNPPKKTDDKLAAK